MTNHDDKIREFRMTGLGMTNIAKEVGLSPATVSRRLAAMGLAGKDITRGIRDQRRANDVNKAVEAYKEGKTVREVAIIAGLSFNRMRAILHERGAIRKRTIVHTDAAIIRQVLELRQQGKSQREIAEEVGIGRQSVNNLLAQNGVSGHFKPPAKIDGDIAYVRLTQDQVAIIDAEDAFKIEGVKWYAKKQSGPGVVEFYAATDALGQSFLMHRILCQPTPRDDQVVDHINGDGLDNRKENLRPVNMSENALNSHRHREAKE